MYFAGPKMTVDDKTMSEMLAIKLNSNRGIFGIDCSTGKEYSFAKFKKDVLSTATAFQEEKFGYGDVVMTTDYGSYETRVVLVAGLLVGMTVAQLDCSLKTNTLEALINESKPDVLLCSSSSVSIMEGILNATEHQPTLNISTMDREGFTSYSKIVETRHSYVQPKKSRNKNRPCAIIYSSGSTGVPKGVYLSDDALKFSSTQFQKFEKSDEKYEYFMCTTPIFWYSGFRSFLKGICWDQPRLFFQAAPTTEQLLCSIDKYKPKFLMTSVTSVNNMMNYQMDNGHKYNIESVVRLLVGGTPMRPELQKTITQNLLRGRIPIIQGYGCTEQGIVTIGCTELDSDTFKNGSVGRPAPGVKIKIVSLETGECVGPNTEGEIRIKSMSNMIGYLNDMKKTIKSYDEDGWFKSGDIGYFTNDCCLFVVGRIKEIMTYKEYKIIPIDIETVLLSHPAVFDVGVTSKNCPDGDLLIGVVKVKPGVKIDHDQLVSYVNVKVGYHEKLRGGVIFVDDVPRSPAGKLNREELKKLVSHICINKLYQ